MNKFKIFSAVVALVALFTAPSVNAQSAIGTVVQVDPIYGTQVNRVPQQVCSEYQVPVYNGGTIYSGGGIVNNNTGNILGGAIIGGILGNQNSTVGGKQMRCRTMSRYKESMETMYSHSTITFIYEGKQYSLNFKK